jgi:translocation and assembly module TamA
VREARELAATEGYFSAKVDLAIEEGEQPWIVRLALQPGKGPRSARIDLRFSGPAVQDPQSTAIFKRVRDSWPLRRGEPFRQSEWDAAKRRALREMVHYPLRRRAHRGERSAHRPAAARRASLMVELESGRPTASARSGHRYPALFRRAGAEPEPGPSRRRLRPRQVVIYQRTLLEAATS